MRDLPRPGRRLIGVVTALAALAAPRALALEQARILPPGARAVGLRLMHARVSERYSAQGNTVPLASPYALDLSFGDYLGLRGEDDETRMFRAFLLSQGGDEKLSLGRVQPRIESHLTVAAPVLSFGLARGWMLALGVPVVRAESALSVDLALGGAFEDLAGKLSSPEINQPEERRLLESEMTSIDSRIATAFARAGYRPQSRWRQQDLGDVQLFARRLLFEDARDTLTLHLGSVLPTGRVKDPDVLLDQGSGDGQWDFQLGLLWDRRILGLGLSANVFGKATAQLPGRRTIRLATEREALRVPKARVNFDPGDLLEAGASLRWQGPAWIQIGAGINVQARAADRLSSGSPVTRLRLLARDKPQSLPFTAQRLLEAELELGLSSLDAFLAQAASVPFESRLGLRRPFAGRDGPRVPWLQWESLFFF